MTRGNAPLIITCTKPGYKPTTLKLDEKIAGATMGNVILGGGIGIIFDASSGAAQRYPTNGGNLDGTRKVVRREIEITMGRRKARVHTGIDICHTG